MFLHTSAKLGRPLSIIMLASLMGCATEPPMPEENSWTEPTDQRYSPDAAYNRAYKVKGKTYVPMQSAVGYKSTGIASWYGAESGNLTANGDHFRPQALTAAHKTLPIPSKVRVTNLKNGRSVEVLVNDRGPFKSNRLIDLSKGAADAIGVRGLAKVSVEYIADNRD